MLQHADLYHTGIVVDDVDDAKAEYSDVMGVTWRFEGEVDQPVWFPGEGARTVTFRFAYTKDGPHKLELVRPIPGTLWTVSGVGHAHHLGYWCDDVPAVSAALEAQGLPVCAKLGVEDPDALPFIVLHRARSGIYLELVSRANRELMFGDEL
jgi:catechol 2,3-dioxygenase-like lactoylglutathione lyase family enzyme